MSNIKFGSYLSKKIGNSYQKYGYKNLAEFENLVRKDNLKSLNDLLELAIENNLSEKKFKQILEENCRLKNYNALMGLGYCYSTNSCGYKQDFVKAIKIYEEVIKEFNCDKAKIYSCSIKCFSQEFLSEKEESLEELERLGKKNGENALLVYEEFKNNEEYEKAIEYLKLGRIHYMVNGVDHFENVDEEKVMYIHYPELFELYEQIGEFDKADEYLEKGCEVNNPGCMAIKVNILLVENKFDQSLEILKKIEPINKRLSLYNFGFFYEYDGNPYQDYNKSLEYFNEAFKSGDFRAKNDIKRIEKKLKSFLIHRL